MEPRRQVSIWRRVSFYGGYLAALAGIGLLASFAFTGIDVLTASRARAAGTRTLIALALIALGIFLRKIGIRGLAGSLVILDPPRAREDLEPWSRAAGGLVDAALSEMDSAKDLASSAAGTPAPDVRVRCPRCRALNAEDARFCGQCGAPM